MAFPLNEPFATMELGRFRDAFVFMYPGSVCGDFFFKNFLIEEECATVFILGGQVVLIVLYYLILA